MDWETLKDIKQALNILFYNGKPTLEELEEYDYEYQDIYDHLYDVYELLNEVGFE